MRIGIFFGGASREREISFAGGRTVYDNLDKSLFEPFPIFVDSFNNFILLDWQYIYKGTIRDFFPPVDFLPSSPNHFQIYNESLEINSTVYDEMISSIGKKINISELNSMIDFAFLALHGECGEDGTIQGLLQWLKIPYSGSGIFPSTFGMDKATQKKMMSAAGFNSPKFTVVKKDDWLHHLPYGEMFEKLKAGLGLPVAIKPANQGSSVGATIISKDNVQVFVEAMDKAFFVKVIAPQHWATKNEEEKISLIKEITDIRESVGLPLSVKILSEKKYPVTVIHHPEKLLTFFENHFSTSNDALQLEAHDTEKEVLIEGFIKGKEFSCIVIQDENGEPIALPPTEIVKGQELFDYRSKYMPGLSRKITPINLPERQVQLIRKECEKLFLFVGFNVYARIDGFINDAGEIFLNDPNTTSGMLPSSFFFHQSAEIGLNPSQFLTFIIATSIKQRIGLGLESQQFQLLLDKLNAQIIHQKTQVSNKIKVAVIMGGYSTERHISVESGRNIFEKLCSSSKYQPVPVFLTGTHDEHELYVLPIQILLKDNADDIKEKISNYSKNNLIEEIKKDCEVVTKKFAGDHINFEPKKISYDELAEMVDEVFIALHGRPGEDGAVQVQLEKRKISYNGSGVKSSLLTINKYDTLQTLKQHGFTVTNQFLLQKKDWQADTISVIKTLEESFPYPFIAKPVDDGCSSAVKKIHNQEELKAFAELMFREQEELIEHDAAILHLKMKEEFPQKNVILIEALIDKADSKSFMEITGGMLTHYTEDGKVMYEIFEPSETLADGEVLSLEEKFLAGQGQNITPARFSKDTKEYKLIARQVKKVLEDAAKVLNVEGYCRIDAFVRIYDDLRADTIIIEVNSLPGMTPATCIYHQAAINHYKPFDFIDKILEYGTKKNQLKKEKI